MSSMGRVARMGEMWNIVKFWSGNLKGGDHSEELGVDVKVIFEWILGK